MYLEKLGVYGLSDLEDILWASILTSDPLLMVGSAGSAKTKVIDSLGYLLGMKTKVYNCAAINFEDLIGYVLPNDEGTEMKIIPSPYAVHDVEILGLDELSRTRVDRQNDMLSIIRERRIQGKKLTKLKAIMAAMNPIQETDGDNYEGAEPLDKAFAERFAWTIVFKTFMEMEKEDKMNIVSATGEGDAVSLDFWQNQTNGNQEEAQVKNQEESIDVEELRKEVYEMLSQASKYYRKFEADAGQNIKEYILEFSSALGTGEKSRRISGRMAGMIYRNILSLAAIQKAMGVAKISLEDVGLKAVLHSFPDVSYSDAVDDHKIVAAHKIAKGHLNQILEEQTLADIKKVKDPIKRLHKALNGVPVNSHDLGTLINEALEELREVEPLKACMLGHTLFYEIRDRDFVTANVLVELAKEVRKLGAIRNSSNYSHRSSDINDKIKEKLNTELKDLLGKTNDEKEKELLTYSALMYDLVYPETSSLEMSKLKSFEDTHEEFKSMLKQFKGVSKKSKVKM